MTEPPTTEPVACTLTADELRRDAADLLPGLFATAQRVEWLSEGARLTFAAQAGLLARIAGVIERESGCCRFLHFALDVPAGHGPVRLDVSGPPGTRDVLGAVANAAPAVP